MLKAYRGPTLLVGILSLGCSLLLLGVVVSLSLTWPILAVAALNSVVALALLWRLWSPRSDAHYHIVANIDVGIILHDLDSGRPLLINEPAAAMYGYSAQDMLGMAVGEFSSGEVPYTEAEAMEWMRRARDEGPQCFEWHARRKDGSLFWLDVSMSRIRFAGQDRILVRVFDITERVEAEAERDRLAERSRNLMRCAPLGIALYRLDGDELQLVDSNPAANEQTGTDLRTVHGHSIRKAFPVLDGSDLLRDFVAIARNGGDRSWDDLELGEQVYDIHAFQTDTDHLAVLFQNTSQRRKTQQQLRRNEQHLRHVLESLGEGVIVLDTDMRIDAYNPVAAQMLCGSDDVLHAPIAEHLCLKALDSHADLLPELLREPLQRRVGLGELRCERQQPQPVSWTLVPLPAESDAKALLVLRDIRAELDLRDQLRQSQKLDSLGQLAGGVAHDFNNMLCAIMGYSELLGRHLQDGHPGWHYLDVIGSTIHRAADLTNTLLSFSHKGERRSDLLDMHVVLGQTMELIGHGLDRRIEIETDFTAERCVVRGDRSQLQNAILNLAVNARDAMPDGGLLRITTRQDDAAQPVAMGLEPPPPPFLTISISDSGVGMAEAIQRRIFEPFFTTKGEGHGTGLGLAAVYATCKEHGGAVAVRSAPGKGATFELYLPLSDEPMPDEAAVVPTSVHSRRSGTILVIDDEESLRLIVSDLLHELGYSVLQAEDGTDGVRQYGHHKDDVDLIILDMQMPGLSGEETYALLRQIDEQVPILLMSGYSQEGTVEQLLHAGAVGFIQKPYRLAQLSQAVELALQE